jgi:hypothetical protein
MVPRARRAWLANRTERRAPARHHRLRPRGHRRATGWLSARGAEVLGDPPERGDATLDFGAAHGVARLHRAGELGGCDGRLGCGCRMGRHGAQRLGLLCECVEAFGELHDEPAEIVELLLEVDRGCCCVVGGFGFGFRPLVDNSIGRRPHAAWTRMLSAAAVTASNASVQQNRGPERNPGKLMRHAFEHADGDGGDHNGDGSGQRARRHARTPRPGPCCRARNRAWPIVTTARQAYVGFGGPLSPRRALPRGGRASRGSSSRPGCRYARIRSRA